MSVLDLALRFNPRPSDETLARVEGTVPNARSLGHLSQGNKPLFKMDKQPLKEAWDSWDTPSAVPAGTLTAKATLGTLGTVGTLGTDIPDEWSEAIDGLLSHPRPEAESAERWARACRGVERFARGWAAKAKSLGWTFEELFALAEPFANVSLQGAAWFVGDSIVTAVTADAITLRTDNGATQRAYRKNGRLDGLDDELKVAIAFLETQLANGARRSFDVEAAADAAGINIETLARARTRLGVISTQPPGNPRRWRLPQPEGK